MEDFISRLSKEEDPEDIYGGFRPEMARVMNTVRDELEGFREDMKSRDLEDPVDHILSRIKDEDSMREKLEANSLPVTVHSAIAVVHDAIGIRVICPFVDDIYLIRDFLTERREFDVVSEDDYIREPQANGYRGLLLVLRAEGRFFIEIQMRTITMDIWDSLEHSMEYKRDIGGNTELIEKELKRCSGELAATERSLQNIRDMIRQASC